MCSRRGELGRSCSCHGKHWDLQRINIEEPIWLRQSPRSFVVFNNKKLPCPLLFCPKYLIFFEETELNHHMRAIERKLVFPAREDVLKLFLWNEYNKLHIHIIKLLLWYYINKAPSFLSHPVKIISSYIGLIQRSNGIKYHNCSDHIEYIAPKKTAKNTLLSSKFPNLQEIDHFCKKQTKISQAPLPWRSLNVALASLHVNVLHSERHLFEQSAWGWSSNYTQ